MTRPRQKRTMMTIAASLDILVLSNISRYLYFYDDRVTFALAFNVTDASSRATLGIIERSMSKADMENAVNVDAFLVLRYLFFHRSATALRIFPRQSPPFIDTIAALNDMYHARYGTTPTKKEETIILTAYDRYRGNGFIRDLLPGRVADTSNQITWYYLGQPYSYNEAYRDIIEDDGISILTISVADAITFISRCLSYGRVPVCIKARLICLRAYHVWFEELIEGAFKCRRIDIVAAIVEKWSDAERCVTQEMKDRHPRLLK